MVKLVPKCSSVAGVFIVDRWSLRTAARRLFPDSPDLARKWPRAWASSPGPRCAVGLRTDADKLEVKRNEARRYLSQPHASITCPLCGMVSYNRNDIKERYCGNCHLHHDDMVHEAPGHIRRVK
jgi:hypothetical protein